MRLSLSMIVRDEERFLPGCLESVKGLVDEMVIVDTGSTDNTKDIARRYGAQIVDFAWCDDFSAARNESLRHTAGDWVLYLDADERIDEAYHSDIRKLISSGKADAVLLNLKSKIGTKDGAQYHLVAYPRLFRKLKGVRFTGQVHEQVTPSLTEAHARITHSNIIIDHLGYAQDDEVILEKARRNRLLLLAQIEKRRNYGYALYQLGQTEIVLRDVEAGLAHFEEALAAGGFGKSVEASIYGIIAENKLKGGDCDAALMACDRSLEAEPKQAFAYIMRGDAYMKLGEYNGAEKAYAEALERYESGILKGIVNSAVEPVFDVDIIYSKLGRAAYLAEDDETAASYLGKSARLKRSEETVAKYLEFLVRRKKYADVMETSNEFKEFQNTDWCLRLVASAFMDTGNFAEAESLLEKVPTHDEFSLSSLANCRMKIGDFAGAESAYMSAIALGYNDPQGLELLGLVQFKLLKFREAAETLSRVVQADPFNARAVKFLQASRQQLQANMVAR